MIPSLPFKFTLATIVPLQKKSTVPPSSGPSMTTHLPTSSGGTLLQITYSTSAHVPPAAASAKNRMTNQPLNDVTCGGAPIGTGVFAVLSVFFLARFSLDFMVVSPSSHC